MSGRPTFSQRAGYEELPAPLDLEKWPATARTRIWNVLYTHLDDTRHRNALYDIDNVGDPWPSILMAVHRHHDIQPLDKWTREFRPWRDDLRDRVERLPFNKVFDLLEFVMQHDKCPASFVLFMDSAFRDSQLGYMIDVGPPPTIWPATTFEEGTQLKLSLSELRTAGLQAATTHLRDAPKCINDGDWLGSVRESIHAVESVARQIDPGEAKKLGRALNSLQKARRVTAQGAQGSTQQAVRLHVRPAGHSPRTSRRRQGQRHH